MGKTKYIDADKVIDYANQEVTAAFYYPQCSQSKLDEDAYREKWAFVKKVMVAAPAVDVVEVVRCKDCKHSEEFIYPEGLETMVCWEDNADREVNRNGFCEKGERKND